MAYDQPAAVGHGSAEFECALIREQQREGVTLAKLRSDYLGRKRTCRMSKLLHCDSEPLQGSQRGTWLPSLAPVVNR